MVEKPVFNKWRGLLTALLVVLFAGALWGQGNSQSALQRAEQVQEQYTPALMSHAGVVGTAVGAGQGAQPVVLVLLEYGGIQGLPTAVEGIPVRPLVTGRIYALGKPSGTHGNGHNGGSSGGSTLDPTSRWPRPVPIGVSTGHPAITAGTISCRVFDGTHYFALSNNHVYANENQASIGDAVIQPGTYDGGLSPQDDIGTLYDFQPLDFSGADNVIDAAIVLVSTNDVGNATPSDGYGRPKSQIASAVLNMPVKKYGRTTGLTKGKIYALNATVDVGYDANNTAHFVHQIIITPGSFSAGGDSGSLVVEDSKGKNKTGDREPVGLLFAGSATVTIANPIGEVLNHFGIVIDGD